MWHVLKLTLVITAVVVLTFNALVVAAGAGYMMRKARTDPPVSNVEDGDSRQLMHLSA